MHAISTYAGLGTGGAGYLGQAKTRHLSLPRRLSLSSASAGSSSMRIRNGTYADMSTSPSLGKMQAPNPSRTEFSSGSKATRETVGV